MLVPFSGDGSGVGELTWGQLGIWRAIQQQHCSMGVGGPVALPPGTTVDAIVAGLRFVMSRHQSLRTRLVFADGHVRQSVSSSGTVSVSIIDIPDDADPAVAGAALRIEYHDREFDYVREFPVRMGIVRQFGVPVHMVALYCHLAVDGAGADVLLADLANPAPVTALQPLALAAWQQGPAGSRQTSQSLRYWERLLRTVPARRFPPSLDQRTPRFWEARFTSRAAYLAVQAVAGRAGMETSPVLLAAFSVALARVTGVNPVVTQMAVGNRFRPTLSSMVSTVVQNGLCVIDVADVTFYQVMVRAVRGSLNAYKYSYYDPISHDGLLARLAEECGESIDIDCTFNDRRTGPRREVAGPTPTGDAIRAALPSEVVRWRQQTERAGERFFFHVNDVSDVMEFWLTIDSHCLSPADTEAFLREIETVLVSAALDPNMVTGVRGVSSSRV
jgi:hypothetical protein